MSKGGGLWLFFGLMVLTVVSFVSGGITIYSHQILGIFLLLGVSSIFLLLSGRVLFEIMGWVQLWLLKPLYERRAWRTPVLMPTAQTELTVSGEHTFVTSIVYHGVVHQFERLEVNDRAEVAVEVYQKLQQRNRQVDRQLTHTGGWAEYDTSVLPF